MLIIIQAVTDNMVDFVRAKMKMLSRVHAAHTRLKVMLKHIWGLFFLSQIEKLYL